MRAADLGKGRLTPSGPSLEARERRSLGLQRAVGRLLAPLWLPAAAGLQRFGMGWKIEDAAKTRATYRRLRADPRPLLVCANHLTLIDSSLIAAALAGPGEYLLHFDALPWNLPERRNFATNPLNRTLLYLMKCLPITRGSSREEVGRVLSRVVWLLRHGETALVFPEGGRSRTGRVDVAAGTYGAGRIVNALGGCRVLCVYLRGDRQETFSDFPVRGERFRVLLECFEPRSGRTGLRASLEVTRQILERLARLEERYFAERRP